MAITQMKVKPLAANIDVEVLSFDVEICFSEISTPFVYAKAVERSDAGFAVLFTEVPWAARNSSEERALIKRLLIHSPTIKQNACAKMIKKKDR